MRVHLLVLFSIFPCCALSAAVENPAVGNVRTTGFAVCWETTEVAFPGLRVFTDAAGTEEITEEVRIELQSLTADRREVGSTPASREAARQLQSAMSARNGFLADVSGLQPGRDYWVLAQALDGSGNVQAESALLPVQTAVRASFLAESRQVLVDLSGAASILGDLSGIIVKLDTVASAYPLFAVVGDGEGPAEAWFDLNHFLDASGEANLETAPGTSVDLAISLHGELPIGGEFTGTQVAYDGSALAASTSIATFEPDELNFAIVTPSSTALLGRPLAVRIEARDGAGLIRPDFNGTVDVTSAGLAGGGLTAGPLVDGVLANVELLFDTLGTQTVTVSDPVSGASTSAVVEVLEYNYDNYRIHYYGDVSDPAGEEGENGDGDPFNNFLEFVYGLNPFVMESDLEVDENFNLLKRGGPVTTIRIDATTGVDFRVTFLRHKNHAAMGLNYIPEFAADLPPNPSNWYPSTQAPTVLGGYGDFELVSVAYPYFTPEARKSQYFRVNVTLP